MKALALYSGGLDSLLAIQLIRNQGVDVTALFIDIGFNGLGVREEKLRAALAPTGADFQIVDTREQFIKDILFSPRYGYGSAMNPCIDCHGNMFRVAAELMQPLGASFLISGEVMAQRPMSQKKAALQSVLKLSGHADLIVRPLSARILPPSLPEREGWINRDLLEGISGRSRSRQIQLAEQFGLSGYDTPAGGCLLTNQTYAVKLKETVEHGETEVEDFGALILGRHFRLPGGSRLVVSRDEQESKEILSRKFSRYTVLHPVGFPGPSALIAANAVESDLRLAISILLSYARQAPREGGIVSVGGQQQLVKPDISKSEVSVYLVNKD